MRTAHRIPFIVDFSLDKAGRVSVFELGNAYISNLKALNEVRKEYSLPNIADIFLANLAKEYPTAVYVQVLPSAVSSTDCIIHNFKTGKKTVFQNHSNLALIKLIQSQVVEAKKSDELSPLIASIPVMSPEEIKLLESLPAEVQERIVSFGSSSLLRSIYKKVFLYHFCEENPLFPGTVFLDLKEMELAKQLDVFLETHTAEYYVVKPPDSTRGQGICLMRADEIKKFVSELSKDSFDVAGFQERKRCQSELFWRYDFPKPEFMIIQTFCPSKTITMRDGLTVIPTGRVVMELSWDGVSAPTLKAIGDYGYWEAPDVPATGIPSTSSAISSDCGATLFNPENPYDGVPINRITQAIDPKEYEEITQQLAEYLTPVVERMLYTSSALLMQKLKDHPSFPFRYIEAEAELKASIGPVEPSPPLALAKAADDYFGSLDSGLIYVNRAYRIDPKLAEGAHELIATTTQHVPSTSAEEMDPAARPGFGLK